MNRDVNRVLNYLTERLEIAINYSENDEQLGYIRARGMVDDARKIGFKPDMREKVKEYIGELDKEIDRCAKCVEDKLVELDTMEEKDKYTDGVEYAATQSRIKTLIGVKNDLISRLEE